jgi:DNA-binding MarR family transcriptional regulator
MQPDRPQAPGYLANLMARLFHEVAGEGLAPLGIRPEQFPILVELWFGEPPVTLQKLALSQEASLDWIGVLVASLAADGLLADRPATPDTPLVLSERGRALRDAAIPAARRANQAAASALSDVEMAQFVALANRVIDALQRDLNHDNP